MLAKNCSLRAKIENVWKWLIVIPNLVRNDVAAFNY